MSLLTLTPLSGPEQAGMRLALCTPSRVGLHPLAGSLVSLALPCRVVLGARHAGCPALAKAAGPCGP